MQGIERAIVTVVKTLKGVGLYKVSTFKLLMLKIYFDFVIQPTVSFYLFVYDLFQASFLFFFFFSSSVRHHPSNLNENRAWVVRDVEWFGWNGVI